MVNKKRGESRFRQKGRQRHRRSVILSKFRRRQLYLKLKKCQERKRLEALSLPVEKSSHALLFEEKILKKIELFEKKYKISNSTTKAKKRKRKKPVKQTYPRDESERQLGISVSETDNNEIGSNSTTTKDHCDEAESEKSFSDEENEDQFILPDIETNDKLSAESYANDGSIPSPLDTINIKVEPCEQEVEHKCRMETDSTSTSCESCPERRSNPTTERNQSDEAESKESFSHEENENQFILPDIETDDNADTNKLSVSSPQLSDASSSSSKSVIPRYNFNDFELLFEAIKYMDEHPNEDRFETAAKYYTSKLKSVVRSQQMLAKKLINKVLIEAAKGNLNGRAVLSHNLKEEILPSESEIQKNIMNCTVHNTCEKDKQANFNLERCEPGYLCPTKNKVLDKIKEGLLKCRKYDQSVESYTQQLRSLSSQQYFLADKLILEILSEAAFGHLRHSSDVHLIILNENNMSIKKKKKKSTNIKKNEKNSSKKQVASSPDIPLKSKSPKLNKSKNISTSGSFKQALKKSVSAYPNRPFCYNLENPSSIQRLPSEFTPTQKLEQNHCMFLNTAQDSSLLTQNTPLIPKTEPTEQNSDSLHTAEDTYTQTLEQYVLKCLI